MWIFPEQGSDGARRLLSAIATGQTVAIAPDLYAIEVANVLWKRRTMTGEITADEAETALAHMHATLPRLVPTQALIDHALHLANALETPLYDCLCLAVALAHPPAAFVTDDRRFERRAAPLFSATVRTLRNVAAEVCATE
jgi:predicted nucleic acid-binding protein